MRQWSLFVAILLTIIFLFGCGQLPDDQLLLKGKKYEAKEQFDKAIAQYEKLVETYPESQNVPEAMHQMALVYANGLQNYPVAIEKLQRVVNEFPESKYASRSQFMIGFIYANSMSDTTHAKEAYETFLAKYPDHELASSVEWELKYLGKNIEEIPELMSLDSGAKTE